MNRRTQAVMHLRDRLRDTTTGAGSLATITRDDADLHVDIAIVQIDINRAVRSESEFQLEPDDVAFLVGIDVWPTEPLQGDGITFEGVSYRVTERPELEQTWNWHDRTRLQRVVFAKEF